jgi:hypothetical protein
MEEWTMAHPSKRDYVRALYPRYASAPRKEKAVMLARIFPRLRVPSKVCHMGISKNL